MSILEKTVEIFLFRNKIKYEQQKRFSFIGKKSLDFYLPDYNIAIECQGVQHYLNSSGSFDCAAQKKRDFLKKKECNENGIDVVYYTNHKHKKIVPKKYKKNTFYNLILMKEYIEKNGVQQKT